MVHSPPPKGSTGPIAQHDAGRSPPNSSSRTSIEESHTASRPSTDMAAVQDTETRADHSLNGHEDHQRNGLGSGEDGLRFPPALRTMTSTGKPYSSFSSGMKWFIVTLAGIAAVFSPIRYVYPTIRLSPWPMCRTLILMIVQISSYPPSRPLLANSIEGKNKSP